MTRQAAWNAKARADRTSSGRCRDCGAETDGYRCDECNARRRESRARAKARKEAAAPA